METFTVKYAGEALEIEIYPKDKMEELKGRIRTGNDKLSLAWEQIKAMDHASQEWKDALQRWHLATAKLRYLCDQLENLGYTDCLYLEHGKKTKKCLPPGDDIGCLVCSSNDPYWEKEFMEL